MGGAFLFFLGCGGGSSPEDTVRGALAAMEAKDAEKMATYFTEDTRDDVEAGMQWAFSLVDEIEISDIKTEVMNPKYICAGSPTFNNGMLPNMGAFLTYFKGLAPKNRIGMAFGSYGWSGQSVGQIEDVLKACGFDMMPNVRPQYIPDETTLQSITEQVKGELS